MTNSESALTRIDPAIVGMIDIVSSTPTIMGNPHQDHKDRADLMAKIIRLMTDSLSAWATVVSFTGDGVVFYTDRRGTSVLPKMRSLSAVIEEDAGFRLHLRCGFAAGVIFHGSVGPGPNIVGVPVVEVARLLQEKEWFLPDHDVCILATDGAANQGAQHRLWKGTDWGTVTDEWRPAGLGSLTVSVYRHT
ncbi:MAG: hypothetical protein ABT940_06345 [Alphaproteobacteria bacterium]